jgi:hypothetical protein
MTWTLSARTRFRIFMSIGVLVAMTATCVTAVSPARAGETSALAVGSFGVGEGITGGIDERTGTLSLQIPLISLPGVDGSGLVNMGISYGHELRHSAH